MKKPNGPGGAPRSILAFARTRLHGALAPFLFVAAVSSNAQFMWHVLRLPVEFFSQRYAGDVAQRQQSNESIAETLISQLAPVALNLGMMVFYFCIMLRYSPILTVIGLVTAALNLFVSQYVSQKRINLARAQMRDEGKLAATTMSGIEMIETIKASGA